MTSYSLNASHWGPVAVAIGISAVMFVIGHTGLGFLFVALSVGLAMIQA